MRLGTSSGAFLSVLGAPRHVPRALGEALGTPGALWERPGRAFGRPAGVLVASRGVPESTGGAPEAPISIFQRFWLDFSSLLARFLVAWRFVGPLSTACVRSAKRFKKTRRFRVRLAFCCSSWPARPPRSSPQLASQRFLRCAKESAPSMYMIKYMQQQQKRQV